jgi:hypothetical protein
LRRLTIRQTVDVDLRHAPDIFLFVICGFLISNGSARPADGMNAVAERYVNLVLALGQHDPDYVDAFYGPPEGREMERWGQSRLALI